MKAQRLAAFARAQRGLFTRVQARGCGYSEFQVRRRIAAGEWKAVLGRVLVGGDHPVTPAVTDRAAALLVPHAVLTAASAARVYGIAVPDPRTFLWIDNARRRPLPGVVYLHDPLSPADITLGEGLRLTRPDRAVFDCLRFLDERNALAVLDRTLQAGHLTHADLVRRVRDHYGRPGNRGLVRLVRLTGSGARSAAERAIVALLNGAGITGWRANQPVTDADGRLIAVGDLVFDAARVVVEIDGWAYHSTPDQFRRDRQRQNRLVAGGWMVLRFTWHDVMERPADVVATVATMIAQSHGPRPHDRSDGYRTSTVATGSVAAPAILTR